MKLGAYTACLHDKPLPEALKTLASLGLESAEINSGGFLPPVHLPIDDLRVERAGPPGLPRRVRGRRRHADGPELQRQPAGPAPDEGPRQAQDILDSIEVAALLGVKRVVTMSGTPGRQRGWHPARVERAAVAQRLPRRARLPVERRGAPVLDGRCRRTPPTTT